MRTSTTHWGISIAMFDHPRVQYVKNDEKPIVNSPRKRIPVLKPTTIPAGTLTVCSANPAFLDDLPIYPSKFEGFWRKLLDFQRLIPSNMRLER